MAPVIREGNIVCLKNMEYFWFRCVIWLICDFRIVETDYDVSNLKEFEKSSHDDIS